MRMGYVPAPATSLALPAERGRNPALPELSVVTEKQLPKPKQLASGGLGEQVKQWIQSSTQNKTESRQVTFNVTTAKFNEQELRRYFNREAYQ